MSERTADELLDLAWGVIANAGFTPDQEKTEGWYEAAERWRDDYHEHLERNRIEASPAKGWALLGWR